MVARSVAIALRAFVPTVDGLVKERLTGAVILVALIVLLVPELLTGPVRPATRTAGGAQPTEGPPLRSYTIKLDEEAHAAPADSPAPAAPAAPAAEPPALAPMAAAPPAAARPAPTPPASETASPPAAPQATPVTASNSADRGWVVQLGSFANSVNAQRLARQLTARGFKVSVMRATTGRRLYRVLVGPTHDRAGALQLAAKLRAAGHSGSIVPR
jgi:DedD protein